MTGRWKSAVVLVALVGLLAGCGSGGVSAQAPSRSTVVQCLRHSHAGGRVYQREVAAKVGALPAHDEIETIDYGKGELMNALSAGGNASALYALSKSPTIIIDLFKEGSEGEEAAGQLAEEKPTAEIHIYAGGAAVSVIEPQPGGSPPSPKDGKLATKCA